MTALTEIRAQLKALLDKVDAAIVAEGRPSYVHDIDPQLIADLKRDEGLRLEAYPDPVSGGAPWTIGYGHTGSDVFKGVKWTQAQAEEALLKDILDHNAALVKALPWVTLLDTPRRRVMSNLAFNLGIGGLLTFKNTLALIQRGDYAKAAENMLKSLWAKQVGQRAVRLAETMRTGK